MTCHTLIKPVCLCLLLCSLQQSVFAERLGLAITQTTENSVLMEQLRAAFLAGYDIELQTVTVASGRALRLAESGEVDVLLTHAPDDEKRFIQQGFGSLPLPVMHNDFILVGPRYDFAGLADASSISNAFRQLATSGSRYISRGDNSGTHIKEQQILSSISLTINGIWYISVTSSMGAALLMASQRQAYALIDRGTYRAFQAWPDLKIVFQGDKVLHNPYHVIAFNPDRHAHVNAKSAQRYIDSLISDSTQAMINDFCVDGLPLFHPVNTDVSIFTTTESTTVRNSFFLDALVSSFRLISGFDRDLFFVVWTSVKVSLLAVLIASLISVPLGLVVALKTFPGKTFLHACLNTLMALPTVVVGLLLYGILNRQGLFGEMGLLYTQAAMVIGQCVLIIPVIWNLSIAAVNGADSRLARTCSSLGASHFQRCLIYMSEVRFALIAAIVTGFGRAIGEVGIAMMLGGNIDGYTRTMTTAIALETSKGDFEFALALGFMLLLVAFVVNTILQQFQLRSQ